MRTDLPTGTVTFLFTDIEGSTRVLHALGPEAYTDALAEHRRVVREAVAAYAGVEVDTQGDARASDSSRVSVTHVERHRFGAGSRGALREWETLP